MSFSQKELILGFYSLEALLLLLSLQILVICKKKKKKSMTCDSVNILF